MSLDFVSEKVVEIFISTSVIWGLTDEFQNVCNFDYFRLLFAELPKPLSHICLSVPTIFQVAGFWKAVLV